MSSAGSSAALDRASLSDLAKFFLRLGTTAFGGPAAHIAIMEDELVRRRRWVSREKFLDMLAASNLIPGPSSSELAIHIGYLLGGWRGLIVAGVCFILPAACMVGVLAWAYVHFGKLPAISGILYGIKPVVIAVVFQALWGLGRTAIKTWFIAVVGLISIALAAWGIQPLLLLLIAGGAVILADQTIYTSRKIAFAPVSILRSIARWPRSLAAATTGALAAVAPLSLGSLFLVFLKFGAVIFGSGYVLLAFLRADLVVRRGWLTDPQLIDAIAIGQVTPGPVFTTATFIGYLLYGTRGAVVATIGIFLPAFLLVAASGPLLPRIRESRIAGAFLDGVIVASLALMAVVSWHLGRASIVDALTAILFAASLFLLLRFRLNSAWLILLGASAGSLIRI
ncbi:MAG: chromate efflux transporter [Methylocella sp.]